MAPQGEPRLVSHTYGARWLSACWRVGAPRSTSCVESGAPLGVWLTVGVVVIERSEAAPAVATVVMTSAVGVWARTCPGLLDRQLFRAL